MFRFPSPTQERLRAEPCPDFELEAALPFLELLYMEGGQACEADFYATLDALPTH